MKRFIDLVIILFQIGLTIFSTFSLYMVFALLDYKGGTDSFIGLTLFQPVLALLFSIVTVIICFVIGLPIRLNSKVNLWWRTHSYLSIVLIFVGVGLCITSLLPRFVEEVTYRMEGVDQVVTTPNLFMSVTGWFILATGTLHVFPPFALQQKVEHLLLRSLFKKPPVEPIILINRTYLINNFVILNEVKEHVHGKG